MHYLRASCFYQDQIQRSGDLEFTLHYIALHIALHCIAHCIALHISLQCIALHCIALHCTLHYITLHYIASHWIIFLHYVTFNVTLSKRRFNTCETWPQQSFPQSWLRARVMCRTFSSGHHHHHLSKPKQNNNHKSHSMSKSKLLLHIIFVVFPIGEQHYFEHQIYVFWHFSSHYWLE